MLITRTRLPLVEKFMHDCMRDSAHDMEHVYRVLNYALEIARFEADIKLDVLTTACLLHDIGREEQYADQSVDHAACGAGKAYYWLINVNRFRKTHLSNASAVSLSVVTKLGFSRRTVARD